jgi:hypothetical protein
MYNRVYKNILAHNIRFAGRSYNGIAYDGIIKHYETDLFYEKLLPNKGYKLFIEFKKTPLIYPIPGYEVYDVRLPQGLSYINDSTEYTYMYPSGVEHYFLIAFNRKDWTIKFVSGQFFLSSIHEDFNMDYNNPSSFVEYLNFRLYRYSVHDIITKKRNRKKIVFSAYSDRLKRKIIITVFKNDLENPRVLALNE